jgi:putative PIN family toxin of toxin-antitoxin system
MEEIVFDTSVLVAGLRSRDGASHQLLMRVADETLMPCVSTALYLEYEDVLNRAEFLDATEFTVRDINRFLSGFAAASRPVEIHFRWRPQLADPNDEFVLEAAVNAGRVPLVTHNTRDFAIARQRFNLLVFTPGQFLRKLTS